MSETVTSLVLSAAGFVLAMFGLWFAVAIGLIIGAYRPEEVKAAFREALK